MIYFFKSNPFLYLDVYPILGKRKIQRLGVNRDTDLVIEGYPRSANTYAVIAFDLANKRRLKIAHHLHAPAQIVRAAHLKKPTLVLIRDPDSAVRSLLIRESGLSANRALKNYIHFYQVVRKNIESVVLVQFSLVTKDLRKVVEALNRRYGVAFEVPSGDDDRSIFDEIERVNWVDAGGSESHVARPSENRNGLEINIPESALLYKARSIYNDLTRFSLG